ncbi:(deoxy)nucleoside triphosphate pyrophosphohydrolase [Novosphingobium profundi]|nr:(deoxy)nucleoside triphosphate pyrophosphohydrolase [Novosphingobium profundi]MBT0667552.1 (deoxy)nucleoside triphosphate pyrophosphohydrolase [Novosphingobium profundi]
MLVVAVALVDAEGRVLLQQRPCGTMHAGLWEFPGGKVDAGESPEDAAVREMEEELGVRLKVRDLLPVGFASGPLEGVGGAGVGRSLVILLYRADCWEGEPMSLEGGEAGWYAPARIGDLAMPPLDYPLARALERVLAGEVHDDFSKKK